MPRRSGQKDFYPCSMPQARLKEYFLNDYKGGGGFEHDAYQHDADEWCWIHKSSGIKARLSQPDAFRPAGPNLSAAPGRCGRMPWTSPSRMEVATCTATSIIRLSLGFRTSRLQARKLLRSLCCTQSPIKMSCDAVCFLARSPCRLPQNALASEGLFGHQWSEGQCVVGTRQGQSCMRVIVFQLL